MLARVAVMAAGTLASRSLGMLRDMATVALLGLSSGVLDALILAFRIPNLFRALFGEGALATVYVPHLAQERARGMPHMWRTASAVLFWLAVGLTGFVALAELLCGALWLATSDPRTRLVLGLSAILLPYLILICLAAQVTATLQSLSRFTITAVAPLLLSSVWLVAAWLVAPAVSSRPETQAQVLAAAILASGGLQLAIQWPSLAKLGFQFQFDLNASRETLRSILPALAPALLALAVTRINTLCDSLVAWLLAAPTPGARLLLWGTAIDYPLESGAAGAIYCAERLGHLPIGLIGVSIATVVYPRLSRQAASGQARGFAEELLFGWRWALLLGVPASAGLWLVAEPLATLVFARGEFTAQDAQRTASIVRGYSLGVWACCAVPLLLRACYAWGDRRTPLVVGTAMVALNVVLNLSLVWHLGEVALAVSTSVCVSLQCLLLAGILRRRMRDIERREWWSVPLRAAWSTGLMCLAGWALLAVTGPFGRLIQLGSTVLLCGAVYLALAWRSERHWLFGRLSG